MILTIPSLKAGVTKSCRFWRQRDCWKSNFRCHSKRSEESRNGSQTGFFTSLRSVQNDKFRVFRQPVSM